MLVLKQLRGDVRRIVGKFGACPKAGMSLPA